MTKADHNDSPGNGTFASRSAARDPYKVRPRRRVLRAGLDADQDFEITHISEGAERVQQITTV
jgi:hypothetical protein